MILTELTASRHHIAVLLRGRDLWKSLLVTSLSKASFLRNTASTYIRSHDQAFLSLNARASRLNRRCTLTVQHPSRVLQESQWGRLQAYMQGHVVFLTSVDLLVVQPSRVILRQSARVAVRMFNRPSMQRHNTWAALPFLQVQQYTQSKTKLIL